MKRFLALFVTARLVLFAVAASAQQMPPLRLLQTIPLPDLKGGDFDDFDVDLQSNRIFLTAEANDAVEVFDIRTNKLIHTIRDVDTPHTLLYLPAVKQLWVVVGGDGTLKIFDGSTYSVIETVKLAIAADSAEPHRSPGTTRNTAFSLSDASRQDSLSLIPTRGK